jgi:large subunit ribosomal protein L21
MPKSKAKARAEAVEVEAKANPKVKAKAKAAEAKAAKGKPAESKSAAPAKVESKGAPRYAVVQARGLQLRVAKDEEHILPRLNEEPGAEIAFDRVLLVSEGDQIQVGKPLVEGAVVLMQVVGHEKGEKIDVGTYKRRKKYRRKIGYRDQLTRVKILGINLPHEEKRGKHGA